MSTPFHPNFSELAKISPQGSSTTPTRHGGHVHQLTCAAFGPVPWCSPVCLIGDPLATIDG